MSTVKEMFSKSEYVSNERRKLRSSLTQFFWHQIKVAPPRIKNTNNKFDNSDSNIALIRNIRDNSLILKCL
jgi:hypothetical protein